MIDRSFLGGSAYLGQVRLIVSPTWPFQAVRPTLGVRPENECREIRESIERMQQYQERDSRTIDDLQRRVENLQSQTGWHPTAWDEEIDELRENMLARGRAIANARKIWSTVPLHLLRPLDAGFPNRWT